MHKIKRLIGERICEDCTREIQNAIDSVYNAGGGTVILNDGEYHLKSILLKSNVTLYLKAGAYIKGSRNPDDYDISDILICPEGLDYTAVGENCPVAYLGRDFIKPSGSVNPFSRWSRAIIKAYRAKNISVIGEDGATFDGQNCYDALGEEKFRGPHFINFHECDGITLKGYTIKNSSNWANAMFTSSNILCEKIRVWAGHDGIDFLSCDNIVIRDCILQSGDDCLAGFDCNNVLIENCEMNTACNAIRVGGNNMVIRNCYIHGPGLFGHRNTMTLQEKMDGVVAYATNARNNMITMFEYYSDFRYRGRKPAEIVIEDCIVENCNRLVSNLFSIPRHIWAKNSPLTSITLKNVKAKGVKDPCLLYASKEFPMKALFVGCDIQIEQANFAIADNCSVIAFENTKIRSIKAPTITLVSNCDNVVFIDSTKLRKLSGEIQDI